MENTTTETTASKFTLAGKGKVLVVPVRRQGGIVNKEHEASFLFGNSYVSIVLPVRGDNGTYVDPLTKEERDFLESHESGLALSKGDLSIHARENNYWGNVRYKLDKFVMELDLSDATDYIKYKVLLANKDIVAPSDEEKYDKGSYKFALVEEGYQNTERVKSHSTKKEAYKFMGKLESSSSKMRDFLNVYYTEQPGGKKVAENASEDFLIAELDKLIEGQITDFLKVANDPLYAKKVLLYKAQKVGAITRTGMTFMSSESTPMGDTTAQAIAWLEDPSHSDEFLRIKARIENNKG